MICECVYVFVVDMSISYFLSRFEKKDVLFSQSMQRPINDIKPLVDLSLHFKTNLYNLTFHFFTIV